MRKITPPQIQYPAVNLAVKLAVSAAQSQAIPGAPDLVDRLLPADQKNLTKRARAKYFSYSLAQELALCDSRLQSSYYRTLTCCSELTQQGDKLTSKYCGARWCLVCNRIRTAKMITKYEPHLKAMQQPHFVTLTIPSVTGDVKDLRYAVDKLQKYCRRAADRFRKYGIKFKGFRKIEITYNTEKGYHPHLHFIIDGDLPGDTEEDKIKFVYQVWKRCRFPKKEFTAALREYNKGKVSAGYFKAELLRAGWMQEFKTSRAIAQNVKPANIGSLKELFKYSAKIITKCKGKKEIIIEAVDFTRSDGSPGSVLKKKYRSNNSLQIHIQALDKIYCAIYGKRIMQPIGYTREEAAEFNELVNGKLELEAQQVEGLEEIGAAAGFTWRGSDWIENATGSRLTGFIPNEQDLNACSSFIFDTG